MTLRSVLPATSMAIFVEDERQDLLTVGYAAGAHVPMLRQLKKTRGGGIAGWAAVNRRGVLNADAALDLGLAAQSLEPPLRSAVTVPLSHDGRVVGVLSCYAASAPGFTEDHLRLLELLAASLGSALSRATCDVLRVLRANTCDVPCAVRHAKRDASSVQRARTCRVPRASRAASKPQPAQPAARARGDAARST